ncbi:hypothetical protein [Nocardia blacklockiae]|nr:hypothetical protein [Nocardia blacklockiae]
MVERALAGEGRKEYRSRVPGLLLVTADRRARQGPAHGQEELAL